MSVSGIAHAPAMEPHEAERIATIVARRLPGALVPVFDARFSRSSALYDEFVDRLTFGVFCDAGLDGAVGEWGNAEKVAGRAGLDPRRAAVPLTWILCHLSRRGILAREDIIGGPRFRAEQAITALDPGPIAAQQRQHDPACLPSYVLAETAAREYAAFLRGGPTGEEILFAPARLPLWVKY